MPFVYILRCSDGSLYVGHTDDLEARLQAHIEGVASTYTSARRPVVMVYSERGGTLAQAVSRERQVKRWSAKKKEALIAGDKRRLKALSQRREAVAKRWKRGTGAEGV